MSDIADSVRGAACPRADGPADYDPLLERIGGARFVLLGEASHGTHEFYRERAEITKRLIAEKGFTVVAVEAAWPDAYRVNCYARGAGGDHDAAGALEGFRRFPAWMWRNTAVADWDEPAQRKRVRPGLAGSYEELFHATGIPRFLLLMGEDDATARLRERRLERAIGVVYRPETERWSHYFYAELPRQFNAVLHLDQTTAVEPLDRATRWETGEAPETFPSAV